MNGAELLFSTAVEQGVDVCFANPGTTEMEMVAALDTVPGVRSVLGLFEGVVTGAADGFARVTGRPALTVMHLGPGFANGIANLHNARRAASPVVNLIGDHASWHLDADAPLTSDIESLAETVSLHVDRVTSATHAASAMVEAIGAAVGPPSGVATIIVPQDSAWGSADLHDVVLAPEPESPVVGDAVSLAATRLRENDGAAILIGGVVREAELVAAQRIADATGAAIWLDLFCTVLESGHGLPTFPTVPYFPEQAIEALAGVRTLVCVGTRPPVAFFGYRSVGRSHMLDDHADAIIVSERGGRAHLGLDALVDALECPAVAPRARTAIEIPTGALNSFTMGQMVAALQPEGAIVVQEAATSAGGWTANAANAAPHEMLPLTGGAIGMGLPASVGAAVGAPDRKVIALQADGSGAYTMQALWTMARESLDVTVVVCANRAYRILQVEMGRTGNEHPGPNAQSLTELDNPPIDWVSIARGFGVPAVQATTLAELRAGLERGLGEDGPLVIEALI